MRVAVAYDCLYPWTVGGGERQYRAFAEEMAARGHDVRYLTRRQWEGAAPVIKGVEVIAVARRARLYDDAGVRRTGPALGFALALLWHLARTRRRYDLVLVSALPATNIPAARLALFGCRTRLVSDWLEVWSAERWSDYSGPVLGRIAWWVQRLAVALSPIATCHSRLSARRLRECGLRSAPVISPGLVFTEDHGHPHLSPTPPRVVYVGRHIPDKRVASIVGAVAHARARVPGLSAVIYGDGPSRAAVIDEVARQGLGGVVEVPGFVDRAVLDEGVRTAAALVNPSAREGYGLVVVDANAVGTPVVLVRGSDNAAVELIAEGVNGTVAESADPVVLGEAIIRVVAAGAAMRVTSHERYLEMARAGSVTSTVSRILAAVEGRRDAPGDGGADG